MMTISNHTAGTTGFCLSSVLLILAIWRLAYHFSSNDFSWTSRRVFHGLFCVAMLVEAFSYADLCGMISLSSDPQISERLGYILLEIVGRSLLEVLTYSVVTALWLETVGKNIGRLGQNALLVSWGAIVLSTSSLQIVEMLRSEQDVEWTYQLHCFVEATCWLLHCMASVACCVFTTKRIVSLSTFPQFSAGTRIKVLVKALLPMMLCSICYGLRSGCLFVYELESRTPTYSRESLLWWIGFSWVPTLIPSLMLLYSTRKRDIGMGYHQDSTSVPLLLSPPGPPAEAFVSFQRLNPESFWSPLSIRSFADFSREQPDDADEQAN